MTGGGDQKGTVFRSLNKGLSKTRSSRRDRGTPSSSNIEVLIFRL